jgi:hypothetical protein
MIVMKYLVYAHQNVPPMVCVLFRWLRGVIGRRLNSGTRRPALSPEGRRVALRVAGLLALAIQIVLVIIAQYLIELSLDLMEVWAELASYHFAITSSQDS